MLLLPFLLGVVAATRLLLASLLLTCMENSLLTALTFDVAYYPNNRSVEIELDLIVTFSANVLASVELVTYGVVAIQRNITVCDMFPNLGVCPMTAGHNTITYLSVLDNSTDEYTSQIPGVAYTIPDLDAYVRVTFYDVDNELKPLACVQAMVTNGKTVQTKYAAWPIAAISGLGLVMLGVVLVMGNSNTAAHIASNSVSLFVYFQLLAIVSMMGVNRVPPIAAAWAQNFVWSLGIIKLGAIQHFSNWYMQATGGTPTAIIANADVISLLVQRKLLKRGYEAVQNSLPLFRVVPGMLALAPAVSSALSSAGLHIYKRFELVSDTLVEDGSLYTTNEKSSSLSGKILILRGILRVAYLAGIEITSLFMTGISFLFFFAFIMLVALMFFKAAIELSVRSGVMNEGKFPEFRKTWTIVIKGTMYRLLLIAFPQLTVLCFWQFIERDSAGCMVLAVFLIIVSCGLLTYAAIRTIFIARKLDRIYKNPAYLLYGDINILNKFGFLYVMYEANAYYWVGIQLLYVFARLLVIGVGQQSGKASAVVVFVVELAYFVGLCWRRPYMDKRTNVFNILIGVICCFNALFYLFFLNLFGQKSIVSLVMAVVYFVANAVYALVLLVFTIVTCLMAVLLKNPDTRYALMKDDRVSFIPASLQPGTKGAGGMELLDLGAAAMKGHNIDAGSSSNSLPFETSNPSTTSFRAESYSPTLRYNPSEQLVYSNYNQSARTPTELLFYTSQNPTTRHNL